MSDNDIDELSEATELKLNKNQCKKYTQSQGYGLKKENDISTIVFNLSENNNNTKKYDIDSKENKLKQNENISIKTTKGDYIDCGDIIRFYNYDFTKKNTIIIIKYEQINDYGLNIDIVLEAKSKC